MTLEMNEGFIHGDFYMLYPVRMLDDFQKHVPLQLGRHNMYSGTGAIKSAK